MEPAAAAAKSLQSCPTLCDPIDGSPPGSPIPGILQARTVEWLPFPSPMHESEKWKWSRWVVSNSSQPHGLWPTRLLHPWDFPGKSTGVGCHCLGPPTLGAWSLNHWATRNFPILCFLNWVLHWSSPPLCFLCSLFQEIILSCWTSWTDPPSQ